MSWRKHEDHRAESKAVKAAMKSAGLPVAEVSHGRGTAWAWLHVRLNEPDVLHRVNVQGDIQDISRAGKDALPFWTECLSDCPACDAIRTITFRATEIIREATDRVGVDADFLVQWR